MRRQRRLPSGRRGQGLRAGRGAVRRGRHLPQPGRLQALRGPRRAASVLLGAVVQVFEDFRYLEQVETGDTAVLMFEARVGDRELQGVDILRFDDDGLIAELTVMVRPMSGMHALGRGDAARCSRRRAPRRRLDRVADRDRRDPPSPHGRRRRTRRDRGRRLAHGFRGIVPAHVDPSRAWRPERLEAALRRTPPAAATAARSRRRRRRRRSAASSLFGPQSATSARVAPEGEIVAPLRPSRPLARRRSAARSSARRSTRWSPANERGRSSGRSPRARATSPSMRRSASARDGGTQRRPSSASPLEVRFRIAPGRSGARRSPGKRWRRTTWRSRR